MAFELATLSNGRLSVSAPAAAVIAAVVAVILPAMTAIADRFFMTKAQASTAIIETGKLELDRRKAATVLFQAALANPDSTQRRHLLEFLLAAGVVDDTLVVHVPSGTIPYWRP